MIIRELKPTERHTEYWGSDRKLWLLRSPGEAEMLEVGRSIASACRTHNLQVQLELLSGTTIPDAGCYLRFPGDKSIVAEFRDWNRITPDLIGSMASVRQIQSGSWRIMFIGRVESSVFYLSSNRAAFSKSVLRSTLSETLRVVVGAESAADDRTAGEAKRQRNQAMEAFKLRTERNVRDYGVVKVFDNWRGERDSTVLWVYHRGQGCFEFVTEPNFDSFGSSYEVDHNGKLHRLYSLTPDERLGYFVECIRDNAFEEHRDYKLIK